MNSMRTDGVSRWTGIAAFVMGLLASAAQASLSPGMGIKMGNERLSPFVELTAGYDSNVRLAEGEILPLQADGSYQVQDRRIGDYYTQFTVGAGLSRILASEWDLRLRGWYDTRAYDKQTQINSDSISVEGSGRYWPISDTYTLTMGGKFRDAQDVERVPSSASMTMPGDMALPYLEERDDRLKRITADAYGELALRPRERTAFTLGGNASTVNYQDARLFDYWQWVLNGDAGYRFSEKTYVFGEGQYELLKGDALSRDVPVYTLRLGFKTKPRVKVDYKLGVGIKTYEHATSAAGNNWKRKWDFDFDGSLNWLYSEKLTFFGKAWTDVSTAQAQEDTRRTYAGQLGADYAFMRRMNAVCAVSYRLDAYDFPIEYGQNRTQKKTDLWQIMGRVMVAPRANTFWKVFVESSLEYGDNDLDTYTQWLIMIGASLWY